MERIIEFISALLVAPASLLLSIPILIFGWDRVEKFFGWEGGDE